MPDATGLSIVIPVLNEAARLPATLSRLEALMARGAEVIVVDGGSSDDSARVALERGARVVHAKTGRARQQNAGAMAAAGELLAFLHADTVPSEPALERLVELARDARAVWGRFDVQIDDPGLLFTIIARCMNLRSRATGVATGDQLIFVSRSLFVEAQGFPEIALMEDVALSKRLRRLGRPLSLRETVLTSARRWQRGGVLRTMLLMWWLRARYVLGASPERLAVRYRARETD